MEMTTLIGFFSFSGYFCVTRHNSYTPSSHIAFTIGQQSTRYAPRRSRNLPGHPSQQAGHDVQRHPGEGDPHYVQEIHEQRKSPTVSRLLRY